MKKFGLIGYPIGHSKSPIMFNTGYAGKPYHYELIEGEDFEESYRKFLRYYDGINVTAPFKELAYAKADLHSLECGRIGAANLLVKTPAGIKAYNSDYYGIILTVLHHFSAKDIPLRPTPQECRGIMRGRLAKALVVGCGGAGKAAVIAAIDLGLEVTLMNRTISKAEDFAAKEPSVTVRPLDDFAQCFRENDLIIYALPSPTLGLHEVVAMEGDAKPKLIFEANYRDPAFDEGLIDEIRTKFPNTEYLPGKQMHLYQAIAGYDLFTGESPDVEAMMKIV